MATDNKSKSTNGNNSTNKNNKKGRHRYLPHNKPVKKGSYPLRPGVQGFFITCDGGRERQASHEAINVLDSFYEELVHGKDSRTQLADSPDKPLNKKTKFTYSDSSSDNDEDVSDDDGEGDQRDVEEGEKGKLGTQRVSDANHENSTGKESDPNKEDIVCHDNKVKENTKDGEEDGKCCEDETVEVEEPPAKKQCLEIDATKCGNVIREKIEEKSVDKLIEAELKELGDKSKRLFNNIDSGCNGVVFVQMRKRDGDPSPKDIVQHMMASVASTKKHVSRYLLRVLPVEVSCYASEEEITNAIKPIIAQYFPLEKQTPDKFAVLYEARANTGIDRMKIINAVAKSVPGPHKVDLNNPDKNIVVQIVKTVCLIGVVEKYKELSKYNLRQLSSST